MTGQSESMAAKSAGLETRPADPWAELSGRQGSKAFLSAWLGLTCSADKTIRAGAAYLFSEENSSGAPMALWSRDVVAPSAFVGDANRLMLESRLKDSKDNPARPFLESQGEGRSYGVMPLTIEGQCVGGLVVFADVASEREGAQLLRHLQWSCGWLEAGFLRLRVGEQAQIEQNAKAILECISLVSGARGHKDATRILTNYLASRFRASRVSYGQLKRGRTRLMSLSHSASFERSMQGVRAIEEAMNEAVDLEQALLFSHQPVSHGVRPAALERLAEDRPTASILALPVALEEKVIGAVVLERDGEGAFTQGEIDLVDALLASLAPMLEDKRQGSRGFFALIGDRLGALLSGLIGPRALGWKLAILLLLGGLTASFLIETDRRISAQSVVEGKVRRILSAPFDGFLRSVAKGPGETVAKGEAMAQLDDSDLSIQRLRLMSQRRQYVLEMDKATATRDLAQSNILRAQIAQSDAELSLVEDMLARTRITAPFDGVVVSGDLSQSIGKPVGRGDELFELAPLDHYRITALVPESDVHLIKPGAPGTILFSALPDQAFSFKVDALTLTARPAEGVNAFEIIAFLDDRSGRIRPGMEGVARIETGQATLFRIWTRKIWHWARLQLWAWWP